MSSAEPHRCTVQFSGEGVPYLAFEPSSGETPAYCNSLFTLDLHPGTSVESARELAAAINRHLKGVSVTVF